jgi:hypothetical protein
MKSRWKTFVISAGMLGLSASTALAFPAYVGQSTNLRWGPSTEFPIQVTVPAGSTVDVGECSSEWCAVNWYDYEGFMYRNLLAFDGGVTVPYVAVFPDYEYYQGYYYGPSFSFRYYGGDFHSRRSSRAAMHSRAESRADHHSRGESRASHRRGDSFASRHNRSESRDAQSSRREAVPEAVRRQREQQRRENVENRRERPEGRSERSERSRRMEGDRAPNVRQQIERRAPAAERPRVERPRVERPRVERQRPEAERRERQAQPPQVRQQRAMPSREARPERQERQRGTPQASQRRSERGDDNRRRERN